MRVKLCVAEHPQYVFVSNANLGFLNYLLNYEGLVGVLGLRSGESARIESALPCSVAGSDCRGVCRDREYSAASRVTAASRVHSLMYVSCAWSDVEPGADGMLLGPIGDGE